MRLLVWVDTNIPYDRQESEIHVDNALFIFKLSPESKEKTLEEIAAAELHNIINWGWTILDDDA